MEKVKKNASFLLAVIFAVVMCAGPVYAAEQVHTNGKWNYDVSSDTWTYTDKQQLKNTWGYIVNPWNDNKPAWFMFDGNGKMLTGWQRIYWDGSFKYFYFHEAKDACEGELQLGGITPDGYTVNKDGVWTVDGAVPQYQYPQSSSDSVRLGGTTDIASDNGREPVIGDLDIPGFDDTGLKSKKNNVKLRVVNVTNSSATLHYSLDREEEGYLIIEIDDKQFIFNIKDQEGEVEVDCVITDDSKYSGKFVPYDN